MMLNDDIFFFLFQSIVFSDVAERLEVSEGIFVEKCTNEDDQCYPTDDFYCPASPTTVPIKSRSNSQGKRKLQKQKTNLICVEGFLTFSQSHPKTNTKGLQVRSRPRRQRTTSINQTTTITPSESIIRSNNRTIYTAGRPPWYNCAGQQVEPFVIG